MSVIIPAFKVSEFIAETLESVFAQTYRNFETIVINDGSPDTAELERAIEPYRRRIIYIEQENRGPAAARNAGIGAARGELLAFLDGDDVWLAEFLERQVAVFDRRPDLDMLWSDGVHFGSSPTSGRRCMELNPSARPVDVYALLAQRAQPLTSFTLVRRSAVLEVGGFDERFERAEDFDLCLRLARARKILDFQPVVLGKWRVRSGSQSSSAAKLLAAGMDVAKKLKGAAGDDEALVAAADGLIRKLECDLDWHQARERLAARDYAGAAEAYRRVHEYKQQPLLSAFILLLERFPRLARFLLAQRRKLKGLRLYRFAHTAIF